jgi:uncharacterized membrane protein YsdA (DUF1294 family)
MRQRPPQSPQLERAADFMWCNARLLERALFARAFLGGSAGAVVAAVRAYRNPDGGFGNAMEPDVRAPQSMPLHCEIALRALHDASVLDPELAIGVCDFLAGVAEPDGRVPIVTTEILDYPRAAHWAQPTRGGDSPNPTAALAGLLTPQGVTHPWLSRAVEWCWNRLERPLGDAHEIVNALTFLEYAPDRARAQALALRLAGQADRAALYLKQPDPSRYGLTPLHLCPRPDAIARRAFADDLLAAHLDHLAAGQQSDGGWPITWTPPSAASELEWRGRMTLEALLALRAYGRI